MTFRALFSLPTLLLVTLIIFSSKAAIGKTDLSDDCVESAAWLAARCEEELRTKKFTSAPAECRLEARIQLRECLQRLPEESLLPISK